MAYRAVSRPIGAGRKGMLQLDDQIAMVRVSLYLGILER
jgi:hypothetical protein